MQPGQGTVGPMGADAMIVPGYSDDYGHWHRQRDYRCPQNGTSSVCDLGFRHPHRVEMRQLASIAEPPRCPDHGVMVVA